MLSRVFDDDDNNLVVVRTIDTKKGKYEDIVGDGFLFHDLLLYSWFSPFSVWMQVSFFIVQGVI